MCLFFYLAEGVIVSRLRAKFDMQCEKQGQLNPVCVSSTSCVRCLSALLREHYVKVLQQSVFWLVAPAHSSMPAWSFEKNT